MPSERKDIFLFVSAMARMGLARAVVPLEVYLEFATQLNRDSIKGGCISIADGAIEIRPATPTQGEREFASADEILEFTTASKKAL